MVTCAHASAHMQGSARGGRRPLHRLEGVHGPRAPGWAGRDRRGRGRPQISSAIVAATPPSSRQRKKAPKRGLDRRVVGHRRRRMALDLAADPGPDLLLGEVEQARQQDQEQHDLEAQALARLEVRLRRPRQEGRDVAGVLVDRLGHLTAAVRSSSGTRPGRR